MPVSKCILDYFEDKFGYEEAHNLKWHILPHLANNSRFTLVNTSHNIGSKILGIFVRVLKKHWQQKYGDELKWILTYVGAGKDGTVYKAAGWQYLGMTKGFHRVGPVYRNDLMSKASARRCEDVTSYPKKVFIKAV